ncbi:FdhF/YdeP family oxidoreductase [Gordonia pseudamarae]|uniref:FdhF/YdeP family oxidoreductase n=1 Tax=Gordonia pseudamarae TaxID=2831662 RepID=A0ABX6II50_9ACTN|nr:MULTISPECIES: FdhF/YdeP family oxidoreductase [Gordonia]MBD0023499.1 FdhF/YdeP family oxidoreductase [Gordonia sp. (in: high G+C Gram-positive bacteria)]QHN26053.1 FdhF/YdeP family oxidoreductase [Gordonia pseudamarae]QHN34978.1 FdhF/YdeP family oxidoreductase [Gordonia pseudamarae]
MRHSDDQNPHTRQVDEPTAVRIGHVKDHAAGVPAVAVALKRGVEQMGVARTVRTFFKLNQRNGFDCPGCAWPETPGHRKHAEFCENGAKAVAEEATTRRVTPEFFAEHSVSDLAGRSGYWLSQQGRLTHPMYLAPGDTHYRPVGWDEANALIAAELSQMTSPDEAVFYTSGRTSNEAAFVYQLFARSLGTNNMPDCSNMCHESSGTALGNAIGIGKGSVTVPDLEIADLIIVAGQNPGTNHPRMLATLEKAKRGGARIVAINPLPEAGLMRFKDPQQVGGVIGKGTSLTDDFLQIRLGGDMALFRGIARLMLDAERAAPGTVFDRQFLDEHCGGVDDYLALLDDLDFDDVLSATGLTFAQIEDLAGALMASKRTVLCWAMGWTQHRHSVATIGEGTNVLLLRGMIGKPGAGLCPVRGHSNVQGDRTMGIFEKMPESFLGALDKEFGINSPREHGYDTVQAIRAMGRGQVRVFIAMGGNFVSAAPDTELTADALRRCALTVHISTKLNESHTVTGRAALILPTLGRTDRDMTGGTKQLVSVEDSMSVVHLSRGSLPPASPELHSEVAIVADLAVAVFGDDHPVDWAQMRDDYDVIRERISRVIPGFEDFNTRVRRSDGFVLPHPPRDNRTFATTTGLANFTVEPLDWVRIPEGRLILQTLRSHDQYNTTIYGHDDRYRGIKGNRRVVMVNQDDIAAFGLRTGQHVDIISEFTGPDGPEERRVDDFEIVAYDTPRGNVAAYYPETNPLVPLGSVAKKSNTPVSKAVVVRLVPAT